MVCSLEEGGNPGDDAIGSQNQLPLPRTPDAASTLIRSKLACCLFLCACASAAHAHVSTGELISADEVLGARNANSAYDLVIHLRPSSSSRVGQPRCSSRRRLCLTCPSIRGLAEPIDVLKTIGARDVVDMRFLDRWNAQQMLGGSHEAGTILVRLRRSR
jgi:hypothetical protein